MMNEIGAIDYWLARPDAIAFIYCEWLNRVNRARLKSCNQGRCSLFLINIGLQFGVRRERIAITPF
jgi:hypothetical protein